MMTQLTFNQRNHLPTGQRGNRDPSSSPEPSSEGNDRNIWMARVRRNDHTGRRRTGSEQTEPQRNIRPKATTNESQLQGAQQPTPYVATSLGRTVDYRGIPPPPQLVTSSWALGQHAPIDARGENLGSPESSTPGYNVHESPSFTSTERHRTHSPLEYTPTHSVSSFDRSASQDGLTAFLTSPTRTESGSTGFIERTLHHGMSILLSELGGPT